MFSAQSVKGEIYRFRSLDALMGDFKELERQTIYLASPDQMNDLAEDVVNAEWHGNKRIWENFITFYWKALIASSVTGVSYIPGSNRVLEEDFYVERIITNEMPKLQTELSNQRQRLLTQLVGGKRVSYYELPNLLREVTPQRVRMSILGRADLASSVPSFDGFANLFVRYMAKSLLAEWRVACFTEEFTNPYLWATYADNNTGACLVFDEKRLRSITVPNTVGQLEIERVAYMKEKPKIDFFANLPRLTVAEYKRLFDGVAEKPDIEAAKNERIALTRENLLTKHIQWAGEKEVRMFSLSPFVQDPASLPSEFTVQYPITALKGVIFGARTSQDDRRAMLDVILSKHFATPFPHEFKFAEAVMQSDGSLRRSIYRPFIGWQTDFAYPHR